MSSIHHKIFKQVTSNTNDPIHIQIPRENIAKET